MTTIFLEKYAPIISDEEVGREIFSLIKEALKTGEVTVDLTGVKSMATFCSKQIFGQLYIELGPEEFYSKIKISHANDDIKVIIRMGIVSAIKD